MIKTNRIRYIFCLTILAMFLDACQRDKQFIRLSSSQTNIEFENILKKREAFGILYYLYYYNGGGVAVGVFELSVQSGSDDATNLNGRVGHWYE